MRLGELRRVIREVALWSDAHGWAADDYVCDLSPGDTVLVLTAPVPEAEPEEGRLFGRVRVLTSSGLSGWIRSDASAWWLASARCRAEESS